MLTVMSDREIDNSTPPAEQADAFTPEATPEATTVVAIEEDTSAIDRYECRACGYTYEPEQGDPKNGIDAGVAFVDLAIDWKCPVCSAKKKAFTNIGPKGAASGFKENLGYGFGVNTMTPGQKNVLIFAALGLGVIFFLSLYTLN
jgi:rubredoxin